MKALLFLLLTSTASAAANTCTDFSVYPAPNTYTGPRAPLKIEKGTHAYRYRTAIKQGADGPPNFGGHLRVVTWGCGTDCHELAVVDLRTGDVWALKGRYATTGYEYRSDSTLLLSDMPWPGWRPGDETAFEFASESYVWDDAAHALVRRPECKGYGQRNPKKAQ